MQTTEELNKEYELICADLTEQQVQFLNSRKTVSTDAEAVEQVGVTRQAVWKWKKDARFAEAYELATTVVPDPRVQLAIPEETRQDIIKGQIDSIAYYLPKVVEENIRLSLYAERESDRLTATKMLYQVLGFSAADAMPTAAQNKVFIAIMNLMGPQIQAEADKRGVNLKDVIDVPYTELEGGDDEDA